MRMTIEERERKFRATFESHNLDRFFAFAQDLMSDCSAADHAQTVWMDRKRELKQRIKELEAQRASVEQERDENEAARTCEKCGKTERGWKYNRCPDCGELAPDHAREGVLRMFVWTKSPSWAAVVLAEHVTQARTLLLEEIGSSGDGSCPEREAAAKWVKEGAPVIWRGPNAEFALTDSAELREQEFHSEKLQRRVKELKRALADGKEGGE